MPKLYGRRSFFSSSGKARVTEREMAYHLEEAGWGVFHPTQFRIDIEKDFFDIWQQVEEYTMTSMERGYALYKAAEYVITKNIPGCFTECGVWKGGSCMLAALTAIRLGGADRDIYLYDTFTGQPRPSEHDRVAWNNRSMQERGTEDLASWAVSSDEVLGNLLSTGYPPEKIKLVRGKVEDTLRHTVPREIALLRLDTDWYESTACELDILYPRLARGGVLIIDDYGHFTGARKAVDEYFAAPGRNIFLSRIDYTGRVGVKQG